FFDTLGGHSLLATQVVARVRQVFSVDLPLQAFFEAPSVGLLARVVEDLQSRGAVREAAVIPRADRTVPLPRSFSLERPWFVQPLAPGGSAYRVTAALRIGGPLDVGVLEQCFRALVERHETLRTTFGHGADGRPVQQVNSSALGPVLQVVDSPGRSDDD